MTQLKKQISSSNAMQTRNRSKGVMSVAVMAFVAICSPTFAAVITTESGSTGAFAVSDSDLLEGITGVVTGRALMGDESTSSDPAKLSNGDFGVADSKGGAESVTISSAASDFTTITYSLNLGSAPAGYDISQIDTFSGWQDDGRINQTYEVLYSTVDAPGTFISIEDVNFAPGDFNSAKASITDDTFVPLATNVGALQFAFGTQQNSHVGYRELDAFGVASVPEPTTTALLGLGGLALILRRRK
jgi:hypothetical protein